MTKAQRKKNGFLGASPAKTALKTARGKLITFEGIEGSGKSTHIRLLAERMRSSGFEIIEVREPGGTRVGETIRLLLSRPARSLPAVLCTALQAGRCAPGAPGGKGGDETICPPTELLLFMASRAQLVQKKIIPALRRGAHVICDRFLDSTSAYQGYARGCDLELIASLNAFAVQNLLPDLTILLDLGLRAGFRRLHFRNRRQGTEKDRIESESAAFHERVRNGYLDLAGKNPERFYVVNADRPVAKVRADIWKAVRNVLER
ncbi:MAG: dTMP kinase [Kiritimatiellia bacterium]|nr:dTMP kinase [Kiritimatiellia bacterium]